MKVLGCNKPIMPLDVTKQGRQLIRDISAKYNGKEEENKAHIVINVISCYSGLINAKFHDQYKEKLTNNVDNCTTSIDLNYQDLDFNAPEYNRALNLGKTLIQDVDLGGISKITINAPQNEYNISSKRPCNSLLNYREKHRHSIAHSNEDLHATQNRVQFQIEV